MTRTFLSLFIPIIVLLYSCKEKKEVFDLGADYYPARLGKYVVYDVTKINFTPTDTDTVVYQLKEVLQDTVTISGMLHYKIYRYTRSGDSADWPLQPDSVWDAVINSSRVVVKENNTNYVKLVFPVEENKSWNANGLNTAPAENYVMKRVRYPFSIGSLRFDNTVTVVQREDTSSLTYYSYRQEVYAHSVGLVYKLKTDLLYCSDSLCIGTDSIESGTKYYQRAKSYGN